MVKSNLFMIENLENIPFTKGYSLISTKDRTDWLLKFKRLGFESYLKKYNSIDTKVKNFIEKNDFVFPKFEVLPSFDMLLNYSMLDIEAYTIVLVNGKYTPQLSSEEELPFSVFSDGLSFSLSDDDEFLKDKLICNENPMVSLNSAYLSGGVVIDIESGAQILKPIHIVSIVCEDNDKIFVNPRVFVNVRDNVKVDIIESNLSLDEKYFENKVCEFNIGKKSFVNHYKYFNFSKNACMVENDFLKISDDSKFNQIVFVKNSGILNNFYQFDVCESAKLDSVMSVDAKKIEQIDVSCLIKHCENDGKSNLSLFATVNDEADVNFTTSVQCDKGTSGVDTKQISRILLNSVKAKGRINPLQHIWSEKVKAYHGAVVSGVDKKDLFFLESRGIDKSSAEILVLKSCLANILQNIHNEKVFDAFYNLIWL